VNTGDRVKIMKPGHPAFGRPGIFMGWGDLDGERIAFIAGHIPHEGKVWPIYVLYPCFVDLVAEVDRATGRRLVEGIIDECEARGCPLRGIYDWAGPYEPKEKITG